MTRILVISDTHIPVSADKLPAIIEQEAKRADLCLHAGDCVEASVLDKLAKLTEVYAVCGNMDTQELKRTLPEKCILTFEDVTIGLTHGRGHPDGIIDYVTRLFGNELEKLDILVFGHSHHSYNEIRNDIVYFNPGSVTDKVFSDSRSFGIIVVDSGKIIERKIVSCD
ncbi:MAG: metallophosphoesterase [Candidatus Omnitrophica bacterium]|jgi:hypothetical protein|nr:metallophosphoesterase [Candidatus Omnitrophota bacterium]MDD5080987.1 metallophosphoesterase [Candidatus Omnitrophota bacterium]